MICCGFWRIQTGPPELPAPGRSQPDVACPATLLTSPAMESPESTGMHAGCRFSGSLRNSATGRTPSAWNQIPVRAVTDFPNRQTQIRIARTTFFETRPVAGSCSWSLSVRRRRVCARSTGRSARAVTTEPVLRRAACSVTITMFMHLDVNQRPDVSGWRSVTPCRPAGTSETDIVNSVCHVRTDVRPQCGVGRRRLDTGATAECLSERSAKYRGLCGSFTSDFTVRPRSAKHDSGVCSQ